jgi:hypothetical protein
MNLFLSGESTRKEVEALNKCRLPELKDLIALFEKLELDTLRSLAKADESARIYRLQGRSEVLRDFLEAVEKAASVLERTRLST